MRPDPEPGTGDQQRDPSADGVQPDPEPGQPARIRNAGSGDQDTGSGCHFLRLQAQKQAVRAAGRINSQANGHRRPEQAESGRI